MDNHAKLNDLLVAIKKEQKENLKAEVLHIAQAHLVDLASMYDVVQETKVERVLAMATSLVHQLLVSNSTLWSGGLLSANNIIAEAQREALMQYLRGPKSYLRNALRD